MLPHLSMPPISEEKLYIALYSLLEQDQLVLLIQIAEKWAIKKDLSSRAGVLEAKAFFRLCMLEQAWRSLRRVDNCSEKLELTLDIYLSRGWVAKSRKVLVKLQNEYPEHPKIEAFHRRITHGVNVPKNYEAILRKGTSSQVLALAERFLCLGKRVLAEKIVRKVLQVEPRNKMARRLLWAQRGDFTSSLTFLQLWKQVNVPSTEVELETTVANIEVNSLLPSSSNVGVPLMFLGQESIESIDPDELTAEITREFVFAEVQQDPTQNLDSFDEEQVTQAIEFMISDSKTDHEIWKLKEMPPKSKRQEDNEVIVFTAQEAQTSEIDVPPRFMDKSVRVIHKNPSPPPAENVENDKGAILLENENDKGDERKSRALILIGLLVFFVLLVGTAFWGIKKIATNNLEKEIIPPIFSAEQQSLQQYILQLKAQEENSIISVEARNVVRLFSEYLYWRDFEREEGVLERIQLELSKEDPLVIPWVFYSLQALMALDEEAFEQAKTNIEQVDTENIVTDWVQIEIAHALGEDWSWKDEYEFSPRLRTLAIIDGYKEPDFNSTHGWVLVASLRDSLGELNKEDTTKIIKKIKEREVVLGSRYGAKFLLLRSLLHPSPDSSKARLLRREAYQKADYDPDVQFWHGYDLFLTGKLHEARDIFRACYQHRIACSSGYTFVLVELEQMDTAKSVVDSLNDAHPMKAALLKYVLERNEEGDSGALLSTFWDLDSPKLDSVDLFWTKLQEQKDAWLSTEETDSIWFWGYQAQVALDAGKYQTAFRSASKALGLSANYTKMYRILAMSGQKLRKIKNEQQYWDMYLEQDPQGFGLELAKE